MQEMLGEEGTEQFTVETRVNGETIQVQPIHDPFIHTTVTMRGWRHACNALFGGITVNVIVRGSEGASRAIMTLNPRTLASDTDEILEYRKAVREGTASVDVMKAEGGV